MVCQVLVWADLAGDGVARVLDVVEAEAAVPRVHGRAGALHAVRVHRNGEWLRET